VPCPTGTSDKTLGDKSLKQIVSFPHGYLVGFVEWLASLDVPKITYADIPVKAGASDNSIAKEFRAWYDESRAIGQGALLLHYDIDYGLAPTMDIIRTHVELGVPASLMVFRKKPKTDKVKDKPWEDDLSYQLDVELLQAFEKMGGVIGYHCHAFEQANGDEVNALDYFEADIVALREHFNIRHFSMHGGYVDSSGRMNATLPVDGLAKKLGVLWVHNGRSVTFTRTWSDGGAARPSYANECSDLLNFVLATGPGVRTRLLMHPQYYQGKPGQVRVDPVENLEWVKEADSFSSKVRNDSEWKGYWQGRTLDAKKSIADMAQYFQVPDAESPVFVHGLSRSGTTLLVSMFDAHKDGAMGYESYPHYLLQEGGERVLSGEDYLFATQCLMNLPEQQAFTQMSECGLSRLVTFAAVTNWTGMSIPEVGALLRTFLVNQHHVVSSYDHALDIVAASCRYKIQAENFGELSVMAIWLPISTNGRTQR